MGVTFVHFKPNTQEEGDFEIVFGKVAAESKGLLALVTVDETWIRHYILETKRQLKQWIG